MKYKEIWGKVKEANRVLIIVVVILAVCMLFLVQGILFLAVNREVSISIPPYSYAPIVVGGRDYIKWWGRYLIDVVSEYSPGTYMDKINAIKGYATSDAEKRMKEKALQVVDDIKRNNMYQSFYPDEGTWKVTRIGNAKWRVEVKGEVVRQVGNLVHERKRQTYYVDVIYKDRLYMEDFGYATD